MLLFQTACFAETVLFLQRGTLACESAHFGASFASSCPCHLRNLLNVCSIGNVCSVCVFCNGWHVVHAWPQAEKAVLCTVCNLSNSWHVLNVWPQAEKAVLCSLARLDPEGLAFQSSTPGNCAAYRAKVTK